MKNKLKTNKSAYKRIKVTKKWRFFHQKCWKSHLLTNKNSSHQRFPYGREILGKDILKIKNLNPYN